MINNLGLKKAAYFAAAAFGVLLLKQYSNGGVCNSPTRIDGKVVIVTGGNGGIGKETVTELVRRGGKVYLACRSLERAALAVADIRKITGAPENQMQVLQLDLGSLESIRSFAKEFQKKEKKLDILVNNAGIMESTYSETVDGFEKMFGTNHLGPFLLTHLLTEQLVAPGNRGRVINLSSRAHRTGVMNFDDLMAEKEFSGFAAYAQSKLANILFTRELGRRYGAAVSVYAVHPGVVRTDLFNDFVGQFNLPFLVSLSNVLLWPFAKEPWNGAQTSVCCAVDEKLEAETGKYYSDCVETLPYSQAFDDEAAKRLWKVSLELVKLEKSEIHPLLSRSDD